MFFFFCFVAVSASGICVVLLYRFEVFFLLQIRHNRSGIGFSCFVRTKTLFVSRYPPPLISSSAATLFANGVFLWVSLGTVEKGFGVMDKSFVIHREKASLKRGFGGGLRVCGENGAFFAEKKRSMRKTYFSFAHFICTNRNESRKGKSSRLWASGSRRSTYCNNRRRPWQKPPRP